MESQTRDPARPRLVHDPYSFSGMSEVLLPSRTSEGDQGSSTPTNHGAAGGAVGPHGSQVVGREALRRCHSWSNGASALNSSAAVLNPHRGFPTPGGKHTDGGSADLFKGFTFGAPPPAPPPPTAASPPTSMALLMFNRTRDAQQQRRGSQMSAMSVGSEDTSPGDCELPFSTQSQRTSNGTLTNGILSSGSLSNTGIFSNGTLSNASVSTSGCPLHTHPTATHRAPAVAIAYASANDEEEMSFLSEEGLRSRPPHQSRRSSGASAYNLDGFTFPRLPSFSSSTATPSVPNPIEFEIPQCPWLTSQSVPVGRGAGGLYGQMDSASASPINSTDNISRIHPHHHHHTPQHHAHHLPPPYPTNPSDPNVPLPSIPRELFNPMLGRGVSLSRRSSMLSTASTGSGVDSSTGGTGPSGMISALSMAMAGISAGGGLLAQTPPMRKPTSMDSTPCSSRTQSKDLGALYSGARLGVASPPPPPPPPPPMMMPFSPFQPRGPLPSSAPNLATSASPVETQNKNATTSDSTPAPVFIPIPVPFPVAVMMAASPPAAAQPPVLVPQGTPCSTVASTPAAAGSPPSMIGSPPSPLQLAGYSNQPTLAITVGGPPSLPRGPIVVPSNLPQPQLQPQAVAHSVKLSSPPRSVRPPVPSSAPSAEVNSSVSGGPQLPHPQQLASNPIKISPVSSSSHEPMESSSEVPTVTVKPPPAPHQTHPFAEGSTCVHCPKWKSLRIKKGMRHLLCLECGAKWKCPLPPLPNPTPSPPPTLQPSS